MDFRRSTPFFVLATQNPIEMEGTYPLPEAQLDRFLLKLKVEYPSAEDLAEIIERTTKPISHPVQKAAGGAEVEAMKALVREVPVPQAVKEYVSRLILSFEGEAEGIDPDRIIEDLLTRISTQPGKPALLPQGL
jgi:MoxR-like ATPase